MVKVAKGNIIPCPYCGVILEYGKEDITNHYIGFNKSITSSTIICPICDNKVQIYNKPNENKN